MYSSTVVFLVWLYIVDLSAISNDEFMSKSSQLWSNLETDKSIQSSYFQNSKTMLQNFIAVFTLRNSFDNYEKRFSRKVKKGERILVICCRSPPKMIDWDVFDWFDFKTFRALISCDLFAQLIDFPASLDELIMVKKLRDLDNLKFDVQQRNVSNVLQSKSTISSRNVFHHFCFCRFIQSLSRCKFWKATGGKSGSSFSKSYGKSPVGTQRFFNVYLTSMTSI